MPQPPKRVLCAEDNEDICFMLKSILRQEGFDTDSAAGASEALELAGREHFDLFILDARFGNESGFDLCRDLRAARPGTPVVFYSGAALDSDREAALAAGARAYVVKPGTEELVEAVKQILGVD